MGSKEPATDRSGRGYQPDLQAFIDEAPWERASIVDFVAQTAAGLPPGARVLDVGAGSAPYRELFAHVDYVTADWAQSMHAGADALDIVAPADDLPVDDGTFDAVLCTQVLEHVAEPGQVLNELFRILRDDGHLYLTAPMVWEEHEMPHDYFRYTRSGLDHLLEKAGFVDVQITARTDSFTTLGQLVQSSKWSLGDADDNASPRRVAFDRLDEIAQELAALAPLDGQRVLPLGYTVSAKRPQGAPSSLKSSRATPSRSPQDPVRSTRTPILYIAPWVDLGGSDKGTIDWFESIDRNRWAPALMTTQPSPNRWVPGLEPYASEIWALPELMPGAEFAEFILGFIESRGVEIVHIMNARIAFDLLPDMTCLANPPAVVVQLHAEEPDRSGYVRYSSTRYGNLIDAYSVTSQQLADAMLDFDVPPSKLHVIPTGVDATRSFDPTQVQPFTDLQGTGPRILWPGRLVQQKDPMLTLDVIKILVDRDLDFTLDIVGDGEMKPAVQDRARELGVDHRIQWYPPSHEMPRWYRSSDLLLMTSVFEGVPYVMYESLAMGVPVVVPALAGNCELLDHPDAGGILIDPRDDAVAYADAVQALLEDDEHRLDLGRRARARMLRDHSLGEMGARHDALYDELLQHRVPRRPTPERSSDADRDRTDGPSDALDPLPQVTFPRDALPERTVSVIVPCYKHGRFIADAIQSIHAQTLRPEQIIVVDDASPDPETIAALAKLDRDPAVTVIRLPKNRGPSVARNHALAEVTTNYVLPLDADDMLLPRALEDMIEQLERAPQNIGFVYPNAQHFGSRHDYYAAPPYNLHTLLDNNFAPATTMFDRRVFTAGITYAESMVAGHEDWDLVLQMAARGIYGQAADEPTFLYRKGGFGRVSAVELGPSGFRREIKRRHPTLYGAREAIKSRWAPALSLVLVDGCDGSDQAWRADFLDMLRHQTCQDFEIINATQVPGSREGLTVSDVPGDGLPQLQEAIRQARGRYVVLIGASAQESASRSTFVEQAIRVFWSNNTLPHFAISPLGQHAAAPMTQLRKEQVAERRPCGVAWSRDPNISAAPVEVHAITGTLDDILTSWETVGPIQWRIA